MLASVFFLAAAAAPSGGSDEGYWHWDNDSPACALFHQSDNGSTVSVTRPPGQDSTTVSFKVRSPKFWRGLYQNGSVSLSTGESFPATIQVFSAENRQYWLRASVADPAFMKALASADTVTIAHREFGKFPVWIDHLASAVPALRSCENRKLRDWGLDVDAYWALASRPRPKGELVDLFSSDNYPRGAAIDNIERAVIARLKVGADGKVESCDAPGHFGYPQFVDSVCTSLKKRASFEPARDATGRKVAAPYVVLVSFKMGSY